MRIERMSSTSCANRPVGHRGWSTCRQRGRMYNSAVVVVESSSYCRYYHHGRDGGVLGGVALNGGDLVRRAQGVSLRDGRQQMMTMTMMTQQQRQGQSGQGVARSGSGCVEEKEEVPELEELQGGDAFWERVRGRPVGTLSVVLCYTSRCMPCKQAKPILKEWETSGDMPHVSFYQFALTMENKETALSMDVRTSPTFLVINEDGMVVHRLKGKAGIEPLKDYLLSYAGSSG